MRKILLILLTVLLPLQWSSAALAALCAQDAAQEHAHAAHGHAMHDSGSNPHAASAHAGHGHVAPEASGPDQGAASHDAAALASPAPAASDDAGGLPLDGCCHAGVSALPARHVLALSPPVLRQAAVPPAIPACSRATDGLFRPPRPTLA